MHYIDLVMACENFHYQITYIRTQFPTLNRGLARSDPLGTIIAKARRASEVANSKQIEIIWSMSKFRFVQNETQSRWKYFNDQLELINPPPARTRRGTHCKVPQGDIH